MPYYNNWNNNSQQESNSREYAIDWEAKTIPLFAYKSCLVTKESLLLSMRGVPDYPMLIAKARFMAAIATFYDTVEVGFVSYLKSKDYVEKPYLFDDKQIGLSDYESLLIVNANAIHEKKLFLLFRILKNWCFEHGPFQTFTEDEQDIFKVIEDEDA